MSEEPGSRETREPGNGCACGGAAATPNAAADCGCCAPPAGGAWIRTTVSALVILAALGLGAYSLLADTASGAGAPRPSAVAAGASAAGTAPADCFTAVASGGGCTMAAADSAACFAPGGAETIPCPPK